MILCSGCFDGLHAGHVAYLEAARGCCASESLVVAVASDEYIRRAKRREPIWTETFRRRTVASLKCVDTAYIHGYEGVADMIVVLRPRWFVKGIDWLGRLPADVLNACTAVGCRIHLVDTDIRIHTSDAVSAHQ